MNIDGSVQNYRDYLEACSLAELARKASEADKRGRRWVAALVREVIASKQAPLSVQA